MPVGAVIEQPDGELAYGAPQLQPRVGGCAPSHSLCYEADNDCYATKCRRLFAKMRHISAKAQGNVALVALLSVRR